MPYCSAHVDFCFVPRPFPSSSLILSFLSFATGVCLQAAIGITNILELFGDILSLVTYSPGAYHSTRKAHSVS